MFLLELLRPCQSHSTFRSVTQANLGGQQATIPPCVEECYRFNMAPVNLQFIEKPGFSRLIPLQRVPGLVCVSVGYLTITQYSTCALKASECVESFFYKIVYLVFAILCLFLGAALRTRHNIAYVRRRRRSAQNQSSTRHSRFSSSDARSLQRRRRRDVEEMRKFHNCCLYPVFLFFLPLRDRGKEKGNLANYNSSSIIARSPRHYDDLYRGISDNLESAERNAQLDISQ